MTWDEKYIRDAERIYGERVRTAGVYLQSRIRKNISIPSRPQRSRPGEFPHRDSGMLRQSIVSIYNPAMLTARIGTSIHYGRYLEFGTSIMAHRPFLFRTLAEERGTIRQIIEAGSAAARRAKAA